MKLQILSPYSRKALQSGQSGALLAIMLVVMLLLVGLVVDTGRYLVARRRAQVAVDSAALAAATALDDAPFKAANVVQLSSENEAWAYATINDSDLVVACDVGETQVTCLGWKSVPTIFMRMAGINSVPVTVSADAEFKYGITEEGQ